MTTLAEMISFSELSDDDKLSAIKNDMSLCHFTVLFNEEVPDECKKLCDTFFEYKNL